MSIVTCTKMSKSYKNKGALNQVTFSLEENKIIGLIGPNGAGKTTLLKLIAGYMQPTAGEIKVFFQKSPSII